MTKKELRAEAKRRVEKCHPELTCHPELVSGSLSGSISKILALPEYKAADIVLSYIAMKNEADPIEITKAALASGKKVAVPRIHPATGKSSATGDCNPTGKSEMDFYFLSADHPIEKQLKIGAFGIKEPTSNEKFVPESQTAPDGKSPATEKSPAPDGGFPATEKSPDGESHTKIFVVTPGLAFSKSGKRCGRGKGFYDKYFSRLKAAGADFFAAGFCYPCQIFNDDEIPTDENDFLMDFV